MYEYTLQHHACWCDHAVEVLPLFRFRELEEALSMAEAHQQEAEDTARQLTELQGQLSALQEQVKHEQPFSGCEQLCMFPIHQLASALISSPLLACCAANHCNSAWGQLRMPIPELYNGAGLNVRIW